jgi:O-antigen/teichoic acid export membrane protein
MRLNKYVRNVGLFLISSVVAKAAGALLSFLLARNLQPAILGVWITMTLFVSYGSMLSLGTIEALLKLFPFHKGEGEIEQARKIEDVVFAGTLITSAFVLVIGCIVPMFIPSIEMKQLAVETPIMAIATALGFISAYFYYRFLAHQDFKIVAMLESGRSILNIMLLGTFSWVWGLTGAALGFCLTELILCAVSAHISGRKHGGVRPLFDLHAIWTSIVIGFPITVFWWIFMVQASVDRLVSIFFLGKESTGYYGLGVSLVSVMVLLPGSISRVLYPRISEKLGEAASEKELFRLVIVPSRFLGLALPAAIGSLVIVLPLVYRLLPKYLPGLASAQILVLLAFFRLGISNGVNFLIATNKQIVLCLYVLSSLFVGALTSYLAVRFGHGIDGIAVSTGISGLFLALLVWRSVFKGMGFTLQRQVAEITKLYSPFIMMLVVLGLSFLIFPQLFVQTGILVIVYAAVFIIAFSCALFVVPSQRQFMIEILGVIRRQPCDLPKGKCGTDEKLEFQPPIQDWPANI